MNYTIKKQDLLKYLKLSAIVLIVVLLQLNIEPTLKTVFAVLLIALSLIGDIRQAMFVFLLMMPVATEISFINDISLTITLVSVNALKYLLLRKTSKNGSDVKKNWYFWAFVLLFYSIIVLGFTGLSEQLLYTIKLFAYLVFIEGYLSECINKYKMKGSWIFSSILRTLGIGIVIAFICLIISGGQVSNATRFSFGDYATTNNTGIQSSFVLIGLLLSRYLKSNKKIDCIIMLFCLVISIATQSRTAILMPIVAIAVYIVSTIVSGRLIRAFLITISLVASLIVLLHVPMINTYYNSINDRFQVEDISHGRYEIWGKTVEQMNSNKMYTLFGAGDYYNLDFKFEKRNGSIEAHNFLIETWVIYGVLGMIILIILLWLYVKENVFKGVPTEASIRMCPYVFAPILAFLLGLLYSHHFIGRGNIVLFVCSFIPIACSTLKRKKPTKVIGGNEK